MSIRTNLDPYVEELEAEIEHLKAGNDVLRRDNDQLGIEQKRLLASCKEYEAEIERLQQQYDKHLDDRIEWHSEIERLNAEVTHYAQAYHREMVSNKKLQAENERLTALRKEDRNDMQRLSDQLDYLSDQNAKLQAVVDALKQIEVRGLEIINEHVGGSDASYVAQELTSMALAALEETDDA